MIVAMLVRISILHNGVNPLVANWKISLGIREQIGESDGDSRIRRTSRTFYPFLFWLAWTLWENVQLATNENRQDVWNDRHKVFDELSCFQDPVESSKREAIDRDWYRGVDLRSCPEFLMILFQPRCLSSLILAHLYVISFLDNYTGPSHLLD